MRFTIGTKIFGIAVSLLVLMGAAALLSLRMTRTIDGQLVVIDRNYFPGFSAVASANVHSLQEMALAHRLVMFVTGRATPSPGQIDEVRRQIAEETRATDSALVEARRNINDQIDDWLDFDDNVELARLDTKMEFIQELRREYAERLSKLSDAVGTIAADDADRRLVGLDHLRAEFERRINLARDAMREIVGNAIVATRSYQRRAVEVSDGLLAIAGLLGLVVAAAVTAGLVRPVRRLLAGTEAVERGALDTQVPITSRDEIGRLTESFNNMVDELRAKARIRETFGKYVDPRIVEGLIDHPDLTDPKGARRQMTILFCDMQGFTSFSEGMTPTGLVTVLNRYLTLLSEPVLRNSGIVDKYIGDAVMAYWGRPFTADNDQARLACFAALDQLTRIPDLQGELPELLGVRQVPPVNIRIGIATGEVVVGSIGSEQTRNYTVIGDTVNVASRLEGAGKAYGTRILISEVTARLAAREIETREIDMVRVLGRTEPERIFELLGRRGEVSVERLELRDTFAAALADYREQRWDKAANGFRDCLSITPHDRPSALFLERIARFREEPPADTWTGVWALEVK